MTLGAYLKIISVQLLSTNVTIGFQSIPLVNPKDSHSLILVCNRLSWLDMTIKITVQFEFMI